MMSGWHGPCGACKGTGLQNAVKQKHFVVWLFSLPFTWPLRLYRTALPNGTELNLLLLFRLLIWVDLKKINLLYTSHISKILVKVFFFFTDISALLCWPLSWFTAAHYFCLATVGRLPLCLRGQWSPYFNVPYTLSSFVFVTFYPPSAFIKHT